MKSIAIRSKSRKYICGVVARLQAASNIGDLVSFAAFSNDLAELESYVCRLETVRMGRLPIHEHLCFSGDCGDLCNTFAEKELDYTALVFRTEKGEMSVKFDAVEPITLWDGKYDYFYHVELAAELLSWSDLDKTALLNRFASLIDGKLFCEPRVVTVFHEHGAKRFVSAKLRLRADATRLVVRVLSILRGSVAEGAICCTLPAQFGKFRLPVDKIAGLSDLRYRSKTYAIEPLGAFAFCPSLTLAQGLQIIGNAGSGLVIMGRNFCSWPFSGSNDLAPNSPGNRFVFTSDNGEESLSIEVDKYAATEPSDKSKIDRLRQIISMQDVDS